MISDQHLPDAYSGLLRPSYCDPCGDLLTMGSDDNSTRVERSLNAAQGKRCDLKYSL